MREIRKCTRTILIRDEGVRNSTYIFSLSGNATTPLDESRGKRGIVRIRIWGSIGRRNRRMCITWRSQLTATSRRERWSTARDMILLRRHVHGGHCVKHRAPFDQLPRASVAIRSRTTRKRERKAPRSTKGRRSREGKKLSLGGDSTGRLTDWSRSCRKRERDDFCALSRWLFEMHVYTYT